MLNIPFYSQRLTKDNFKIEGFESLDQAQSWTKRICGLACLKMVIYHFTKKMIPLKILLDAGISLNGYIKGVGWIHQKLANIAMQYGMSAYCQSIDRNIAIIYSALKDKQLIIASVSCGFNPTKRGGHLVLIIGNDANGFIIHHPSANRHEQWSSYSISENAFIKSFSEQGNIILISGLTE